MFARQPSYLLHIAAWLGIVLVFATASPVAAQDKRFEGVTLVVGTFGGSWKDRINEYIGSKFRELGGELTFVTGNHTVLLSMLIAARGQTAPMDVVEITDPSWPVVKGTDLLRPIDLKNVPNVQHLDERMYDQYKVANWIVEEGVVYNVERFKEQGIAEPKQFSDLLNPKLRQRVALPDIGVNTIINPIVGFAADAGGDEHNIAPGLEQIKKLNVYSFVNSSTQIPQLFESGDIWAGVVHAGWGVRMYDAGLPVCFSHPIVKDRRGMASAGFAAITANSEHPEAAEWYINMLISKEMQTILHIKNGVVPTNKLVQEKYAGDPKLDACGEPFLLMSPEEIANLYYIDYDGFDMSEWTKQWNTIVLR